MLEQDPAFRSLINVIIELNKWKCHYFSEWYFSTWLMTHFCAIRNDLWRWSCDGLQWSGHFERHSIIQCNVAVTLWWRCCGVEWNLINAKKMCCTASTKSTEVIHSYSGARKFVNPLYFLDFCVNRTQKRPKSRRRDFVNVDLHCIGVLILYISKLWCAHFSDAQTPSTPLLSVSVFTLYLTVEMVLYILDTRSALTLRLCFWKCVLFISDYLL